MSVYEKFLTFEIVINVTTVIGFNRFCKRCEELGLTSIKQLQQQSFIDLHKSGGLQRYSIGELCIEFKPDKGFAIGSKQSYLDYGCEIIHSKEFLNTTDKKIGDKK